MESCISQEHAVFQSSLRPSHWNSAVKSISSSDPASTGATNPCAAQATHLASVYALPGKAAAFPKADAHALKFHGGWDVCHTSEAPTSGTADQEHHAHRYTHQDHIEPAWLLNEQRSTSSLSPQLRETASVPVSVLNGGDCCGELASSLPTHAAASDKYMQDLPHVEVRIANPATAQPFSVSSGPFADAKLQSTLSTSIGVTPAQLQAGALETGLSSDCVSQQLKFGHAANAPLQDAQSEPLPPPRSNASGSNRSPGSATNEGPIGAALGKTSQPGFPSSCLNDQPQQQQGVQHGTPRRVPQLVTSHSAPDAGAMARQQQQQLGSRTSSPMAVGGLSVDCGAAMSVGSALEAGAGAALARGAGSGSSCSEGQQRQPTAEARQSATPGSDASACPEQQPPATQASSAAMAVDAARPSNPSNHAAPRTGGDPGLVVASGVDGVALYDHAAAYPYPYGVPPHYAVAYGMPYSDPYYPLHGYPPYHPMMDVPPPLPGCPPHYPHAQSMDPRMLPYPGYAAPRQHRLYRRFATGARASHEALGPAAAVAATTAPGYQNAEELMSVTSAAPSGGFLATTGAPVQGGMRMSGVTAASAGSMVDTSLRQGSSLGGSAMCVPGAAQAAEPAYHAATGSGMHGQMLPLPQGSSAVSVAAEMESVEATRACHQQFAADEEPLFLTSATLDGIRQELRAVTQEFLERRMAEARRSRQQPQSKSYGGAAPSFLHKRGPSTSPHSAGVSPARTRPVLAAPGGGLPPQPAARKPSAVFMDDRQPSNQQQQQQQLLQGGAFAAPSSGPGAMRQLFPAPSAACSQQPAPFACGGPADSYPGLASANLPPAASVAAAAASVPLGPRPAMSGRSSASATQSASVARTGAVRGLQQPQQQQRQERKGSAAMPKGAFLPTVGQHGSMAAEAEEDGEEVHGPPQRSGTGVPVASAACGRPPHLPAGYYGAAMPPPSYDYPAGYHHYAPQAGPYGMRMSYGMQPAGPPPAQAGCRSTAGAYVPMYGAAVPGMVLPVATGVSYGMGVASWPEYGMASTLPLGAAGTSDVLPPAIRDSSSAGGSGPGGEH
ncbi:hypothetical protein Agub_g2161 [Astrephomene gubernaculifera]|uniref:Uncharacterized protein n=1 Tax=Astrephomene gubernaculifera TaxID=47775 RepID=A0AAD3DGN2_9CHLO|nr:hypothetical protein Agub_g2161 [Astrephomene gubernaculifera]